jgi:hypothetical protein
MGDEQEHEVADISEAHQRFSASLTNLETTVLPEAYYYSSLPLCVIDTVYSIGVNYESTRRTVSTWCDAQTPPRRRVCNELAKRGEDHHGWLLEQAALLRSERHDSLDWSNLAEELEAMAAAQRRKIKRL